jgi:hypothetical protein
MRTTLTLDEDVAQRARAVAARTHLPFKRVINAALRQGLDHVEKPQPARPYRTKSRPMGLRPGLSLDNIQELLAHVEGERAR